MRSTLARAQKELSRLRSTIATDAPTVVFRAVDADQNERLLTLAGTEFEGDVDEVVVLDVVDKAILPLFAQTRHVVLHGGRAGGKTETVIRYLTGLAFSRPTRILVAREVISTLRDSLVAGFRDVIESVPQFEEHFEVLENEIRGQNGSLITFIGLRRDRAHNVKSYYQYDLCWIEESQALSRRSVDLIGPTIRQPGSRIVWTGNPEGDLDPWFVDFIATEREDATVVKITYLDNPFVSPETIADAERDRINDPPRWRHIWNGELREKGEGAVFPNFVVIPNVDLDRLPFRSAKHKRSYGPFVSNDFEREFGKGRVFAGMDLGVSDSPTILVLGWLSTSANRVVILDEFYAEGEAASLDNLAKSIPMKLPILKEHFIPIWCDSAWPHVPMHLRARGLNVRGAPKWNGSVAEGILRLRSCELMICERCEKTIRDFSLYSFEEDANGVSTGVPEKKHDHAPDAVRYGIHGWIRYGIDSYHVLPNVWR